MPSILDRSAPAETLHLRPLNDLVYVRQDRLPDKQGNFFLPDSTRKHKATLYGTVLAVGPGKLVCYEETCWGTMPTLVRSAQPYEYTEWVTQRLPLSVKPGDRVAFMDFAGTCVGKDTDPSLLLMEESEILAVMG